MNSKIIFLFVVFQQFVSIFGQVDEDTKPPEFYRNNLNERCFSDMIRDCGDFCSDEWTQLRAAETQRATLGTTINARNAHRGSCYSVQLDFIITPRCVCGNCEYRYFTNCK